MSDLQGESTQRWARLATGGAGGGALLMGSLTGPLTMGEHANFNPIAPEVDSDDNVSLPINTDKTLVVYDAFFLEPFNSPLATGTRIYYTKIKGKNWYVRHACST